MKYIRSIKENYERIGYKKEIFVIYYIILFIILFYYSLKYEILYKEKRSRKNIEEILLSYLEMFKRENKEEFYDG